MKDLEVEIALLKSTFIVGKLQAVILNVVMIKKLLGYLADVRYPKRLLEIKVAPLIDP